MDILEELQKLAARIRQFGGGVQTEEATKTGFIMPFINSVLGYDVFNPSEVIPEFTADVGIKKGEKVDYAIKNGGDIQLIIECKKLGEDLTLAHSSQLYRYFSVTSARIAVLTNGRNYRFYTDLDSPNKMDEKPFLELDILDIDEHTIPELAKLTKTDFNVDSVINAAGELKSLNQIKKLLALQFTNPDEDFVRFVASSIYDGSVTQKVREQFFELIKKAGAQFLNDQVNDRLKSAINRHEVTAVVEEKVVDVAPVQDGVDPDRRCLTTDEVDGFNVIRAIAWQVIDIKRLAQRSAQSYSSIFADDNNRKPVCRLYFTRAQKQIGVFDEGKQEVRFSIAEIGDMYAFADKLRRVCAHYASVGDKDKRAEPEQQANVTPLRVAHSS